MFDDTDGAQDVKLSGTCWLACRAMTSDQEGSTSSYKVGGTVAGVALTFTGTDNDDAGGDATKICCILRNGQWLDAEALRCRRVKRRLKTTHSWFLIRNGRFDCWLHNNQARFCRSFGDEWDFLLNTQLAHWLHLSHLDETDATTIIADYALGGGASAFAAMHDKAGTDNDLTTVGLNFAF